MTKSGFIEILMPDSRTTDLAQGDRTMVAGETVGHQFTQREVITACSMTGGGNGCSDFTPGETNNDETARSSGLPGSDWRYLLTGSLCVPASNEPLYNQNGVMVKELREVSTLARGAEYIENHQTAENSQGDLR